jgi:hypothetical protein
MAAAKKDFSKLTEEEITKLQGKEKAAYDKWFSNQNDPQDESEFVIVKALRWVNTSKFGNAQPGQKLKVPSVFADALVESGEAEIIDEE